MSYAPNRRPRNSTLGHQKGRHAELCRTVRETLSLWGCVAFPVRQIATPVPGKPGVFRRPGNALMRGVSDIIACTPCGRFVAVEVKTGRDRVRPEQEWFLQDVQKRGGIAIVCYNTIDALLEHKKEILYGFHDRGEGYLHLPAQRCTKK